MEWECECPECKKKITIDLDDDCLRECLSQMY